MELATQKASSLLHSQTMQVKFLLCRESWQTKIKVSYYTLNLESNMRLCNRSWQKQVTNSTDCTFIIARFILESSRRHLHTYYQYKWTCEGAKNSINVWNVSAFIWRTYVMLGRISARHVKDCQNLKVTTGECPTDISTVRSLSPTLAFKPPNMS